MLLCGCCVNMTELHPPHQITHLPSHPPGQHPPTPCSNDSKSMQNRDRSSKVMFVHTGTSAFKPPTPVQHPSLPTRAHSGTAAAMAQHRAGQCLRLLAPRAAASPGSSAQGVASWRGGGRLPSRGQQCQQASRWGWPGTSQSQRLMHQHTCRKQLERARSTAARREQRGWLRQPCEEDMAGGNEVLGQAVCGWTAAAASAAAAAEQQ
jgi:hypothetical protein